MLCRKMRQGKGTDAFWGGLGNGGGWNSRVMQGGPAEMVSLEQWRGGREGWTHGIIWGQTCRLREQEQVEWFWGRWGHACRVPKVVRVSSYPNLISRWCEGLWAGWHYSANFVALPSYAAWKWENHAVEFTLYPKQRYFLGI